MMDISLIGTGGMMPLPNRYLTSLICRFNGNMLMVDCGEGTQVSMKLLGWGYKNVDAICFTHYHADHITGLPGLLLAISNAGRTEDLTLIGPPELERVVKGLTVVAGELSFELRFLELAYTEHTELPVPGTEFFISALPLEHGRPCFGYAIETKRRGKFDIGRAETLNLPKQCWSVLQKGGEVSIGGKSYTQDMVLGPPRKGFKVCYCTDTRPTRRIPGFIAGADLFVCEGMYGDPEKYEVAKSHMHMIYPEAAALARSGAVKKLWLTHYSPAMVNPKEFIGGAKQIFGEAYAAYDRITCTLSYEED